MAAYGLKGCSYLQSRQVNDVGAWSSSGRTDIRDDGGVYQQHVADEAGIHMKVEVVDENCSNDHSTDLPLDRTHAHEDTDSMEEVGGDNLHTDRTDGRGVVGVGLLHNNNHRTVGAVDEVEVPATIRPIHDFVS